MESLDDLEVTFKKATDFVKTIAGKLDSQKLLYLYARFKQANEGPCNIPKPGFFDFQGKQKWEAWKKMGAVSKMEAMSQYVMAVTDYDIDWEDKMDSGAVKPKSGMGVSVSTMAHTEEEIADENKTVFDWCKEGNMERVRGALSKQRAGIDINRTDENGMSLLHWSCDRGYIDMLQVLLLERDINVNLQDADGQTPLHYAVACEHADVVKSLLKHRADINIQDCDGQTALEIAENSEIKALLSRR